MEKTIYTQFQRTVSINSTNNGLAVFTGSSNSLHNDSIFLQFSSSLMKSVYYDCDCWKVEKTKVNQF